MEEVFVYWNLRTKTWAIRSKKTRRVIKHSDYVELQECSFKVSKKGRERVLKEKRKNVHAGVCGKLVSTKAIKNIPDGSTVVTYNPYKYTTFVQKDNLAPVFTSIKTLMLPNAFVLATT